jgi:uncharacterized Tic20 family protein
MSETPPPPPPQYAYTPPPPLSPSDERLWATLVHAGGIFFGILPSLVGYLVLKDRGTFIREHIRVALNFQITMLIALVAGSILSIIVIGIVVLIAVGVLDLVFCIMAAVAASNGQLYKYPLSIEFIK